MERGGEGRRRRGKEAGKEKEDGRERKRKLEGGIRKRGEED